MGLVKKAWDMKVLLVNPRLRNTVTSLHNEPHLFLCLLPVSVLPELALQ